jgi:hypothetical protein
MSGTTGHNSYNVGSDSSLNVIANGAVLSSTILTSFDFKQVSTQLKSVGIDGKNRYRELEEGWSLSMEFDRGSDTLDAFIAAKEAARYSGAPPPVMTITQTITNPDGSIAKYRFSGVTVKLENGGKWAGDSKVTQTLTGMASRRIKVQ